MKVKHCSRVEDCGDHSEFHVNHPVLGHRVLRLLHSQVESLKDHSVQVVLDGRERDSNIKAKTWVNRNSKGLTVFLFPDCPPGLVRDHINGDALDNRPENVRFLTRSENALNNWKRRSGMDVEESASSRSVSFRVPLEHYEDFARLLREAAGNRKHGAYLAINDGLRTKATPKDGPRSLL